ncbi:MAG: hypothetical protein BWY31_02035 [Lentisphaerae bacterium ADurb.Bin242]|nr:MAG: hypothetical protein BWY31_02035 [Lentisphaerae bacterium ADurb.Bin242]
MKNKIFLTAFIKLFNLAGRISGSTWAKNPSELGKMNFKEYQALMMTYSHPFMFSREITLKELAERMNMQMPAESILVTKMVRKKLLCRTVDPNNRRCVRISVAARGRRKLDAMLPEFEKIIGELDGLLSKKEVSTFCAIINRFHNYFFQKDGREDTK